MTGELSDGRVYDVSFDISAPHQTASPQVKHAEPDNRVLQRLDRLEYRLGRVDAHLSTLADVLDGGKHE